MRIQVLVDSRQARQALNSVQGDVERTKRASRGFGLPWMSKWGNQVQWAGRQLIYNFTLPLALAGTAATKWALENEKAMTRVAKVYGDGSKQFNKLSQTEIPALAEAFEALSNRFGVHHAEVINIGADWAAAGASGLALARAVELTMETMVLGEVEAAEATKNLIAIQAQYGQSIGRLSDTISILNMVENQTGASMRDLMEGMARAAGVARESGVDVEHLAAMIAQLTPAAGSAANAGNGLKTIISRILSPTSEAKDLLREMGVQIDEAGWNSLTATQRIEQLADGFDGLSDAQKTHMATVIGSRWQLNRIIVLMRGVRNENSYYNKSLQSTADEQAVFNQKQHELRRVLESNPKRMEQAWVMIKNAITDVIVPLLPYITWLASEIASLANSFSQLSMGTQKWILVGLVFLALIGPIARYIGSVTNLVGLLVGAFHGLAIGAAKLLTPFRMAGGAILAIGRYIAYTSVIWALQFTLGIFKMVAAVSMLWALLPKIRAFMIAVAVQFRVGWAVVAATWVTTLAALRALWIGWTIGFYTLQVAFSKGVLAIWALMSTGIVAMFGKLLRTVLAMAAAMFTPVGAAIAVGVLAVVGIVYALQDHIVTAFEAVVKYLTQFGGWLNQHFGEAFHSVIQSIINAFWALPTGIQDALIAVLRIIQTVALQIYEWMSYLNPFARHSPSLVENVTAGMDVITSQFARLKGVGGVFQSAYAHLAKYNRAMGGVGQFSDDRKTAGNKGLFDAMIGDLKALYPLLRRQEQAMSAQERVVDALQARFDEASYQLNKLRDAYQGHEAAMQSFADAPIRGMGAFSDKLFENQMAQKRLQLQMAEWENANGSIDNMRDRLGLLQGDIEELTGRASELRMAGAGSDILGPIQDQISAIEAQAKAVRDTVNNSPVGQVNDQLAQLQREGELLQLQYDIKYDPLTRQIENLANAQKELGYEEIIDGINRHKAAMDRIQPNLDAAQRTHDQLQRKYDAEKRELDALTNAYQRTNDVVSDLESALRGMGQAGAEAAKKAKKAAGAAPIEAVKSFRAAAGGNWPDPGGIGKGISRSNMQDQSQAIRDFAQDQLDEMNSMLDKFDMMGPLKEKWNTAWGWLKSNVGPAVGDVGAGLQSAWGSIAASFDGGRGSQIWGGFVDGVQWVVGWIVKVFNLIAPDLKRIVDAVVQAGRDIWNELGPELVDLGIALKDMFVAMWPILKRVGQIVGGVVVVVFKLLASIISNTLAPAFDFVIDLVKAAIRILKGAVRIITGVLDIIMGIGTNDWGRVLDGLKNVFGGLGDMFVGLFKGIFQVIWNAAGIIWGIIWGIVVGIWEFFVWLKNILVGHSVVPDMIDAIVAVFKTLVDVVKFVWNEVLVPLYQRFVSIWKERIAPFLRTWFSLMKGAWKLLLTVGRWIWNNVLKPLWNRFQDVWDLVKTFLGKWWGWIKGIWKVLFALGRWVWTNVLKPVLDAALDLWERVKRGFSRWWDGIKTVWNSLTRLGSWVKQNVMDPVLQKIKDGWNAVKDWLTANKDMLTSPVRGIVNVVIRAVNALIKGLNKISDVLPGDINWNIGLIPELAKGDVIPKRRVGSGFQTSGARAIVGEGKANWPEFVIPTDPTHRRRAVSLMNMAAGRLGMLPGGAFAAGDTQTDRAKVQRTLLNGIPAYGIGGWLGDVAKGAWNKVKGVPGKVAQEAFTPYRKAAEWALGRTPWRVPELIGKYGLNRMNAWIGGLDSVMKGPLSKSRAGGVGGPDVMRALRWARSQQGKPYQWGGVGPSGYDCSGFMAAIMNVIDGRAIHSRRGGTGSMPWPGMVPGSTGSRGFNLGWFAGSPGHTAGTLGGVNVESAGGVGVRVGGPVGWNNSMFRNSAHYTKAAQGAIVRATRDGTFLKVAEAGRDEAVTPLPRGWKNGANPFTAQGGGTTININGDLSFPNITDGDDAKTFVENLKVLARD